uniref:Peptidase_M13_N domain-containing protein n=1 Tax=Gongylonema pulchrum TaxID=637853 RepID=A0A183CZ77_9BILA
LDKDSENVAIGTSPGYIKAAFYLSNAINQTANPCSDFFAYACGRWISDHPIPSDLATYGVFASIREKVAREMKELYEAKKVTGSKAMDSVKTIFEACMAAGGKRNLLGRQIVEAVEFLGYWPVIHGSRWSEKKFELTELMIRVAQSRYVDTLISVYASPDQKNVSRRLIHIDQGSLGLGAGAQKYYLDEKRYEKQLKAYKKYITDMVIYQISDVFGMYG